LCRERKNEDEEKSGEYRTKRMVLEAHDTVGEMGLREK
jgi:hypothetical protein